MLPWPSSYPSEYRTELSVEQNTDFKAHEHQNTSLEVSVTLNMRFLYYQETREPSTLQESRLYPHGNEHGEYAGT